MLLNSFNYQPIGWNQTGQYVYSYRGGGIPTSFSYLTTKVSVGTGKSDSHVRWNLSVPVVATAASACSCEGDVLRTMYGRIELSGLSGTSIAEREDLYARILDLVKSNEFRLSVTQLVQASGA